MNIDELFSNIELNRLISDSRFILLIIVILTLWIINKITIKVAQNRISNVQLLYHFKKTLNYIFVIIGVILIGVIWSEGVRSIPTFLGLVSAGLAIALKDLVVNIAGWFFIIWRRPFEVGDRIQIGENSGDVIDQRLFQFTLLEIGNWVDGDQSTGRIIHIPNSKVFNESQANYSKGFKYIWNEIFVVVTFESDWKKAKDILRSIADKHAEHLSIEAEKKLKEAAKKFMIFYNNLTPNVYTDVKASGVQLTIRYLCEPRRRRSSVRDIWEDILLEFAKHDDIDLAYNTQRIVYSDINKKN